MSISAVSGYNTGNEYQKWVDQAAADAEALENRLGVKTSETTESSSTSETKDSTSSSTSSSSSSTSINRNSSTSTFLLTYKNSLTSLETTADKLRLGNKNNVFAKYETALKDLSRASTDEDKAKAQKAVDAAKDDIVAAIKDFAESYNNAVSFLESNSGRSNAVNSQLASLKRALTTGDAMARIGLSIDKSGKLQVDEKKLKQTLDENYASVKDIMGGQFGIAERAATKASDILDNASVERIAGISESEAGSASADSLDYWTIFSGFATSGAYNLSNYYAVGSMLNTVV